MKSVKVHPKNPNYLGKKFKTPEKKVNKYNVFLENPLKELEDEKNKLESLLELQQSIKKIKSPIRIESKKFDNYIKKLDDKHTKKIAIALPIIIYRLSTLIIKQKDTFGTIFKVFHNTVSDTKDWDKMSYTSKVVQILYDYMKLLYEKGTIFGFAEIIILAGIVLDDIPMIIMNNDYIDLKDLAIFQLTKKLAKNVKDLTIVYEAPLKEMEKKKEAKQEKEFKAELNTNIQNLQYSIVQIQAIGNTELANKMMDKEFKSSKPISPSNKGAQLYRKMAEGEKLPSPVKKSPTEKEKEYKKELKKELEKTFIKSTKK